MKKFLISFVLGSFIFGATSYGQIKVNSSGYVGINTSNPVYNLDWHGTGRFSGDGWGNLIFDNSGYSNVVTLRPENDWVGCLGQSNKRFNLLYVDHVIANIVDEISDETVKENITDLTDALDNIKKLRGVRYSLKSDFFDVKDNKLKAKLEKKGKNQIGFLAQELKEIFPEMVHLDSSSNLYSVNYTRLVPVLAEAIKEQQNQIEELKSQINYLEQECCNVKEKNATINNETDIWDEATLNQNVPNPFNKKTTISCSIPSQSNSAILYIFNMQGTQMQQHQINGRGQQEVNISGNSLVPGMYLYTLVIDGKEIDTKRMILTK